MRKAAGILMVIYSVITIVFMVGFLIYFFGGSAPEGSPLVMGLAAIISLYILLGVGSFALSGNLGKYASLQALPSWFYRKF